MTQLHKYDISYWFQAMKFLVPPPSKQHYPLETEKSTGHHTVSLGGPILCRDQLEEWSAAEANLFEEAIEKYGKDFNDIRHDFVSMYLYIAFLCDYSHQKICKILMDVIKHV